MFVLVAAKQVEANARSGGVLILRLDVEETGYSMPVSPEGKWIAGGRKWRADIKAWQP